MNLKDRFEQLCHNALAEKGLADDYNRRLTEELREVNAQNEHEYFLDLYDRKVRYGHNPNNLLIPYLLGIVDSIDISKSPAYDYGDYPDIDQDFVPQVRDFLKNVWAPKTFGQDRVCNIGSYSTFGIKSALIDMTRVFGKDRHEILELTTKLSLKDDEGKALTWDKAMELYPDLKNYCEANPEVADAAQRLLHRNRGMGKHAGGLIISSVPIDQFVPLVRDKEGTPLSAWVEGLHGQDLGPMGLIKFDMLVITNLMQIALAVKMVKERHNLDSFCALPGQDDWSDLKWLNDKKALAMADKGDLKCIFQFDSAGIRNMVKEGGVDSFDDLVTYASIFRPGPMQASMHNRFIARKRGKESYFIPDLVKPILGGTHGVMCVHQNAMISLTNGCEVPIKDVKKGDVVHSFNENRVEPKECHGCGPTRKIDGILVVLENGLSTILTDDHEVLTYNGMKRADCLDPLTDLIAVPRRLPQSSVYNKPIADWLGSDTDVAYLLGFLLGDGCLTSCGFQICTGEYGPHCLLRDWIVKTFPALVVKEFFYCRAWYLYIRTLLLANDPRFGHRKTKISVLLHDLDMRHASRSKTVPEIIMRASSSIRWAFLAGLIDSDGCLMPSKHGIQLCFLTSTSELILNSVRKLLLIDGIYSHQLPNRLYIWNTKKISSMLQEHLKIKTFTGKLMDGKKAGWVPRTFLEEQLKISGLSQAEFCRRYDIRKSHFSGKNRSDRFFIREHVVSKLVNFGDLKYVKIANIERVFNQQFYGMSVADNHNFVCDGIVVKNCYQEQVIKILNVVGGIPLKDCEIIRKAISKKKSDQFAKYKSIFLEVGKSRLSCSNEEIENWWVQIEKFSEYGFNLCLTGDMLVFDRVTNNHVKVEDLVERTEKVILDSYLDGDTVPDVVLKAFSTGEQEVYEVELTNGMIIRSTLYHKFLCADDKFHTLKEILDADLEILFENTHIWIKNMQKCKVKSIKSLGLQKTYNLTMKSAQHNYAICGLNPCGIMVYSLNSHATAYTYVSVQLLYLKAHYPLEFFAAILSCEEQSEKIKEYKIEAENHDIPICPLDLNKSGVRFQIVDKGHDDKDAIFIGFANVKGIGDAVAQRIVQGQSYKSYRDFLTRFGTDGGAVKALIGLKIFKEAPPALLWKYSEWFKEIKKKREDRVKRFEKSCEKTINELQALLPFEFWEHIKGVVSYEVGFANTIREFLSKWQAEHVMDEEVLKQVNTLVTKYQRSCTSYQKKLESNEKDAFEFDPSDVTIDSKLDDLYKSTEECEKAFYGFMWTHLLEKSPDFEGWTFEKFRSEEKPAWYVEVRVLEAKRMISKKKTVYYSLKVEDANSEEVQVIVWEDDWLRFEDWLTEGALVRIMLRGPSEGFSTWTLDSPKKHLRHKLPTNREYDFRVIVMQRGQNG